MEAKTETTRVARKEEGAPSSSAQTQVGRITPPEKTVSGDKGVRWS